MDLKKLLKDIASLNISALKFRADKLWRLNRRYLHLIFRDSGFDVKRIPVVINNRNRFTYLKALCAWLDKNGFSNIIILDNDSTYEPLLNWYKTVAYRVIFLNQNIGPRAVWIYPESRKLTREYYIYTDADVVPEDQCTAQTIKEMYIALKQNPTLEKVGLGLRIDDLPKHFALRDDVIQWESRFQSIVINEKYFVAPVDTTFAMYAPYARGGGECKAWRTTEPLLARHMPWYENTENPEPENLFYIKNAAPLNSHWTELTKQ